MAHMKKPARTTKEVARNQALANSNDSPPKGRRFPLTSVSWAIVGISSITVALCMAATATDVLQGNVRVEKSQSAAGQPGSSSQSLQGPVNGAKAVSGKTDNLLDKYGAVANSESVAAAIRKAEATGGQNAERAAGAKAAADREEALAHGYMLPGTDPTSALMYGFVPPGMSQEQATILSSGLPKLPRTSGMGPMTPERADTVAGVPPNPMNGLPQGIKRQDAESANQRVLEGYMRGRFGPVYVPLLNRDHNRIADSAARRSDHQISLIEAQYAYDGPPSSIREMTDSNGNIVSQYEYDPYGKQTKIGGTGLNADFGYAGIYVHQPSGLLMMGARVYNAATGRFLNRDPAEEAGGTDLYAYVQNNPINRTDPLGTGFTELGGGGSINGPTGPLPPNPIGAQCWDQCKGKLPVLGPVIVAGGLPLISVGGKIGGGSTAGTSPFSVGLRGLMGDWGGEFGPYWGPTFGNPFSTTPSLGGALGRLAPLVGAGLAASEYADFLNCIQNCNKCHSKK
jgi:RHS repeat-associated protein